jgi:hypothetical protein
MLKGHGQFFHFTKSCDSDSRRTARWSPTVASKINVFKVRSFRELNTRKAGAVVVSLNCCRSEFRLLLQGANRPPSEGAECRLGSSIIKTASQKKKDFCFKLWFIDILIGTATHKANSSCPFRHTLAWTCTDDRQEHQLVDRGHISASSESIDLDHVHRALDSP